MNDVAIQSEPSESRPTPDKSADAAPPKTAAGVPEDGASTRPADDRLARFQRARQERSSVEGKVIGWNNGGFHVVVDGLTAFCPRSEMEIGHCRTPAGYVDKTFGFHVLKIREGGRRVILSRAAALRQERGQQAAIARQELEVSGVYTGTVTSITDFGAFVEVGGTKGLVHVSELARRRVEHPGDVVEIGQEVRVKVLKIEEGGNRVSLSMRALEPDPWQGIRERYPEGTLVTGRVERTAPFGAFIELEPGLTGLLPTSSMGLPRDASPARAFRPGREVAVQVVGVDPRRRRISLAPQGSSLGGSRADYEAYQKRQREGTSGSGFNAIEAALRKFTEAGQ